MSLKFGRHTLPTSEIFGEEIDEELTTRRIDPFRGTRPQPEVPRPAPGLPGEAGSSGKGKGKETVRDWENTPEWRREALSLLFQQLPLGDDHSFVAPGDLNSDSRCIPPLTELCLRVLLETCSRQQFTEIVVPYLQRHLRRILLRWAAIHSPLSDSRVYALSEPDDSVGGELIFVGPHAALRSDFFETKSAIQSITPPNNSVEARDGGDDDEESWDSQSSSSDDPLPVTSLALVMTPLPTRIILTFPPTLSHLSLLSLSAPTPVYHLTRICPLLEFLDLSYNPWLPHVSLSQTRSFSTLDRIHWTRWTRLRILGLRRCGITWDIGKDVNKDRWVDVEIIGLDLDEERMS